jgi:hypothetical protein
VHISLFQKRDESDDDLYSTDGVESLEGEMEEGENNEADATSPPVSNPPITDQTPSTAPLPFLFYE